MSFGLLILAEFSLIRNCRKIRMLAEFLLTGIYLVFKFKFLAIPFSGVSTKKLEVNF